MSNDESTPEAPLSTEWGGDGGGVKRCYKCALTKPFDAFSKRKTAKDGRDNRCKACVAEYYAANAEHILEQNRAWRSANPEYKRAYDAANAEHIRAYYTANAERLREQKRAWQTANAETIREQKRVYRAANAERLREQKRAWQAANRVTNPEIYQAAKHRRRARLKANGGNVTAHQLATKRASQNGFCFYCRMPHDPQALTIDHVIPLDQGGPHVIANIVFACGICNSSKGNRTPEEWTDRWYDRKK